MPVVRDALSHVTGSLNIDATQVAGSLMMLGIAVGVCFLLFRLLLLIFKLGLLVGALYFLTFFIGIRDADTTSFALPNNTSHQNTLNNNPTYAQVSSMNAIAPNSGPHNIPFPNAPFLTESSNMNSLASWELVSDKISDTIHFFKEYEFSIKKKG